MGFADFDYAALLYKDDEIPANPESKDFVQGTETEDGKLIFSFQRPDDTSGTFTLELFAFVKTEGEADEDAMQFSRETALLSGNKTGLSIVGDIIEISEAIPLSSSKPGTVSLKIKVPDECSLEIDDTANFNCKKDDSASDTYTIVEKNGASGIATGAYQVKFTVKKDEEIIYIFSEYINVINGLCTDTWWNGDVSSEVKDVSQSMSKTVYVRGSGAGWYDVSDYKNTATASDENSGSFLAPLATIQKAIDKIIAINDGSSAYTIYVDGTLDGMTAAKLGDNGMADFINLNKNLNLTIKTLSSTATLDAGARLDSDGTATVEGIGKRVIYAKPAYGTLNLTLENLTITGGNSSEEGGGIYVYGGTLDMKNCKVEGNITKGYRGGGISVVSGGNVIMDGGTISRNEVRGATSSNQNYGGGVYVSSGRFIMKGDAIISENILAVADDATSRYGGNVYVSTGTFEMEGGTISGGNAKYGAGVYVYSGEFTMKGGEISGGNANSYGGGGIYNDAGMLTIESGTKISGCESGLWGGGIYNGGTGTAVINGCTIESCKAKGTSSNVGGGGIFSAGTLTVTGGTIYKCTAESNGGGLFLNGSQCTVAGVTISECTATYGGGVGLYTNATFTMEDGTIISENTASEYGGGVYVYGSTNGNTFTMTGGTISENTAQQHGGGVFITGTKSTFTMTDGTITGNTTDYYGGGVYVTGSTFTMEDGEINNNNANSLGGGVYLYSNGTFMMKGGTISDCTAEGFGGGIYNGGTFTIGGEACIPVGEDGKNDVYIVSGKAITVASDLTAPSPVATITLLTSAYAAGKQVLSAGTGVPIIQDICDKFALSEEGWQIVPKDGDSTAGVLKAKEAEILDAIYLDSSNGDDTNSGLTASKSVKTLSKAIDLFDSQYAKKIIVCAAYTLLSGERGILDRMGGG
ncbi:MAG: right-handed parallel beta-helix repeat-containing protein [Treponema sp.]|nr:right-handed parallel beta-helix repeat-containing protein [Treponema sp.]